MSAADEKTLEAFKVYASKPWLKSYDEGVPAEVEIPEVPLYQFLLDSAEKFPNRTALIFYGTRVSFSQLAGYARRFARFLKEQGVGRGDVVSLLLPNSPQFAIAYYGTLMSGATVSPMNVLYTPREIRHQLENSEARVLVALDVFKDKVEKGVTDRVEKIVWTGVQDFLSPVKGALYKLKAKPPKVREDERNRLLATILKRYSEIEQPEKVNPREDVAALMYTGGTTGVPKGAMLTHYNLVANVVQIDAWYKRGVKGKDVVVGALPWFHIYGQTAVLNYAMYRAATIIVFARWDTEEVMKAIDKYKPNIFHGVPLMYQMINNHPKASRYNLRSLEGCISGAAPLPVAVAERFEQITGAKLREGYGLTETSPVTHVNPLLGKAKKGSIGLPIPSTLAAVADPVKPVLLPPGEVGELVISGPQVMKGYYKMPEENREAFFDCCGYRWFRTGDMAYMDEEGYFFIVDRKKDIIKYKGYSIYPREIEEVLYKHPCVLEAAVVGSPHPEYFEVPKAFIALKPECKGKVTEKDIIEWASKELAPIKVPKIVEFRDELPKTAVGKVLRRVLREEELRKAQQAQQR